MQPSDCFKISFFVLIVAGVWYSPSWEKSRYLHAVNIYRVFAMIMILIGMLSIQFVYFFTVVGVDLDKTIDATALFTFVGHLYKAITVIINRRRINKLLEIIDSEEDKDDLMQSMAEKISFVSKIYNGGAGLTAVMWNLIPFTKPTLTLPFYYPDLPSDSPWFVRWYAYQTVILIINGVAQTSADHVFGGLMAFAATQLKLLQYKLETIGSRKETEELDAAQREQDDYKEAVSCVRFHLKIIGVVDELTSIFGAAAFGQFLLAAPLLCLSAFILTTSSDPTEIITRLLYFGCISGQLFFYCFCGNMIKIQSDLVATAAYNCSWETTSVRTQKTLKLLILRGQKTLSVVAGNLFELSLVTFGALLKSSYSFFAVLNKKHND
uniref:Odorant receptor n=1 Tax=Planotortrix excessana TaxID=65035 RepID=A0A0B5CN03_9NEOP|nr:olfactory receptor OR53 [Planotortrix excessana]